MSTQQRMTKQRRKILEVLKSTTCHPTADWIYNEVKKEMPTISLGTVYRNLSVLKTKGEILELNYGSTFSRYDGNPTNHYHFTCNKCLKVYDVDIPLQSKLNDQINHVNGHKVDDHRIEFYGTCRECLDKKDDQTLN
ncbi:transcriptional repressor [Proteinivorax hydrogeniformans]|uniref:Transcriptional repressor n=1 Tax=Proteinivorax hydrogeniformans TaxID=1826727 RepID=A0AAU8HVX8_9FIRM